MNSTTSLHPQTKTLAIRAKLWLLSQPAVASPASRRPTVTIRDGRRWTLVALSAAAVLLMSTAPSRAAEPAAVSLDTARADLTAGRATLIDIREPDEHAEGVAPGAQLLPMSQLRKRIGEVGTDPQRPIYLICHTQSRSSSTARALQAKGYTQVRFVDGGMREWKQRGWPLVKPGG